MEDEYITVKTAMLAKQKGFNEPCRMFYHSDTIEGKTVSSEIKESTDYTKNDIPVPTQSLLGRWIREIHRILVVVSTYYFTGSYYYCILDLDSQYTKNMDHVIYETDDIFETFEEAYELGLEKALTYICKINDD